MTPPPPPARGARPSLPRPQTTETHAMFRRALLRAACAAAIGLAAAGAQAPRAHAQGAWPTRPITMIVPFAAGGPTDVIARLVGEHMSRTLGQQIVIENVAGAGGTTGTARAAGAQADGYTIMMGHMGTHGAAPALYPNLRYDPASSFAPIGLAAGTPIVIVVKKAHPAQDLRGFTAHMRAAGDKATLAHAGVGSVSHSTGLLLLSIIQAKPTLVTYRGTGPALNDLMAGTVDAMADQIVNVAPQITAGTIRALAIATPERSPALPDVPTTAEAGLPDYQVSAWNAMFAPKNTPEAIVAKLNDALVRALDDETTRKRLLDLGGVIPDRAGRSPEALQRLVVSEVARWMPVLRGAAGPASN